MDEIGLMSSQQERRSGRGGSQSQSWVASIVSNCGGAPGCRQRAAGIIKIKDGGRPLLSSRGVNITAG